MTNYKKEIDDLIPLLEKAEKLLGTGQGGYSDHFFKRDDFQKAFKISLGRLKKHELKQIDLLLLWFTPSYDWDDFDGEEELGNEIYSRLNKIHEKYR